MSEKKKTGILILFGCMIFVVSILSGIVLSNRLNDPEFCNSCHEMQTYYASYLNPKNGSIIKDHELNCIQCHSGRNIYDAKKQVLIKVITYDLNLSGASSKELKPDCSKCHSIPSTPVHKNATLTNCIYCHWAHSPADGTTISNISLLPMIPYGPHVNQTCIKCHGTTYQIPRCINCHTGHGEQKLENNLCLICHKDPHVPTIPGILPDNTVNFTKELPFSACQPCHEKEYSDIIDSGSRHKDMETCSLCHLKHGMKPVCSQCHRAMKVERHLDNLQCGDCHKPDRLIACEECHGESHGWSASTATVI
jgi:nitrate/TMAO reductase-like tetraheme cytochrome c subunit